ncbi:MAG: membrane dipeptidase, partial [Streptomyces sp.]|nr:membrane dipeptidase [Streptomyces sp.]
MAELQDDLHPTTEVADLDGLPLDDFFPTGTTGTAAPATDPDTGLLQRAHALLAEHPVADGYSG